jgi:TRAP-type C4-dicarboxylate transport system permease large subunit
MSPLVMVQFLSDLLGHIKGGLSYVLVAAVESQAADMAAIAPVLRCSSGCSSRWQYPGSRR